MNWKVISCYGQQNCHLTTQCHHRLHTVHVTECYRQLLTWVLCRPGMSNMRPFASTPAARTKDTVIWSFKGQNFSFYNLNWINVRRSQKNSMLLFIRNVFYTWKYDFY